VALAALFFLAATVVMTWPQAAHMNDALSDYGDAKLVARILQWDYHQTFRDPGNLFQLNFFHPARYVLAFSENLFGVSILGFPLLAAGASPLLNYNVLLLSGIFLSALSAWALARYVTGDALASVVAGLVYAFLPWRVSQLSHFQFQWGPFLCLALLFLLRLLDGGRRRDALLFGILFAWNLAANIHYGLFAGMLLVVVLVVERALRGPAVDRRIGAACVAAAIACVACLPLLLPYVRVSHLYGMSRGLSEIAAYSGRFTDFLSAGVKNAMYGAFSQRWLAPEGDFFPGLLPLVLAGVAIVRVRRVPPARPEAGLPRSRPAGRAAVRALDLFALLAAGLWAASLANPGLRIGRVGFGDASRVQVLLTLVVAARLSVAFPARSRYRDLADFLRQRRLEPRAVLLLFILVAGALIALGSNTPYYRFLVKAFGSVFRAIRAPSRGIVLFDLALGVLASWGLASLLKGRSALRRTAWTGVAVGLLACEYWSLPPDFYPTPPVGPPVYGWMASTSADVPGAFVEWPLGTIYDFEYVFRQAEHGKALVNGYSGFFPQPYAALQEAVDKRPIPDSVWPAMGALEASVLVYHSHEWRGFKVIAYADALDRALASGGLELVRSFAHGPGLDFVFVPAGASWKARVAAGAAPAAETRRLFDGAVGLLRRDVARLAPPFGVIHLPRDGQSVAPGFWAHGWALDDSGIAEVQVATELGPAGFASLSGAWPGLAEFYPRYPDAGVRSGYGFGIPDLPPGPHTLRVMLVGNDGGRTVMERSIVVEGKRATPSPIPKGPGS
jgi:hypothetical protein